jgi:predicted TIM-barrel fold metal-dependent hydrolase
LSSPIVDIHCHNFNGDDLPVRGFVQRVELRHVPIGSSVSLLLDLVVQQAAPGFQTDKAKLDRLLGEEELESTYELPTMAPPIDVEAQFEREVEEALLDLQDRNPAIVRRVGLELAQAEERPPAEEGLEGVLDILGAVRRAIKWVKLFAKSRLDVTALMVATFKDEIDLYCPLLVDMGASLGDFAATTMRQQVELQEKISRLSMRGRLPGGGKGRIHPFVGFDPRAEVKARMSGDLETPLELVKTAIERYGFVGVKVYPPMGWRPIGNEAGADMTAAEAAALDRALRDFYAWCEEKQVPVTAHCNDSNYADDFYRDGRFAGPDGWIAVLQEFPELHLNLGHFGGAREDEKLGGWPWTISRASTSFPHLYADVGNHDVYDSVLSGAYLEMLRRMFEEPATEEMVRRIMYGSDWYMLALHPECERFLDTYRELFERRFGSEATAAFMGNTALRFLGFGDVANQNAQRLRARYERFAPDRIPTWL